MHWLDFLKTILKLFIIHDHEFPSRIQYENYSPSFSLSEQIFKSVCSSLWRQKIRLKDLNLQVMTVWNLYETRCRFKIFRQTGRLTEYISTEPPRVFLGAVCPCRTEEVPESSFMVNPYT